MDTGMHKKIRSKGIEQKLSLKEDIQISSDLHTPPKKSSEEYKAEVQIQNL